MWWLLALLLVGYVAFLAGGFGAFLGWAIENPDAAAEHRQHATAARHEPGAADLQLRLVDRLRVPRAARRPRGHERVPAQDPDADVPRRAAPRRRARREVRVASSSWARDSAWSRSRPRSAPALPRSRRSASRPGLGESDTWALVGRGVLAMALWATIGVGLGSLVPNQVAAIVIVIAFTQFVEPILRLAASLNDVTATHRAVPAGRRERRARRGILLQHRLGRGGGVAGVVAGRPRAARHRRAWRRSSAAPRRGGGTCSSDGPRDAAGAPAPRAGAALALRRVGARGRAAIRRGAGAGVPAGAVGARGAGAARATTGCRGRGRRARRRRDPAHPRAPADVALPASRRRAVGARAVGRARASLERDVLPAHGRRRAGCDARARPRRRRRSPAVTAPGPSSPRRSRRAGWRRRGSASPTS